MCKELSMLVEKNNNCYVVVILFAILGIFSGFKMAEQMINPSKSFNFIKSSIFSLLTLPPNIISNSIL